MAKIRFVSFKAVVAKIRRLLEEEGIWIHQVPSLFDTRPADVRVIGQPAEQGSGPCFLSSGDDDVGKHWLGSLASRVGYDDAVPCVYPITARAAGDGPHERGSREVPPAI